MKNDLVSLVGFLFVTLLFSCSAPTVPENNVDSSVFEFVDSRLNSAQVDSTFEVYKNFEKDSSTVDLFIQLYRKSIKAKSTRKDILDSAFAVSQRIGYKGGMAQVLDKRGLDFRYNSAYEDALREHKHALGYFTQTTDTLGTIICLNNLGVVLRKLNHEQEAMNYYIQSLDLANQIKNDRSIAIAKNGIGNVFVNMGQYNKALQYFKEALALEEARENDRGINYDLSNIGEAYMLKLEYDSAKIYYEKALEIGKSRDYKSDISIDYFHLGVLYQKMGQLEESVELFQKALPRLEKYNSQRYLSKTLIYLGKSYTGLNAFDRAQPKIQRGLDLAQEIKSQENILLAYDAFVEFYKVRNLDGIALAYREKSVQLTQDIFNEQTKRNIAALEVIYESELQNKELENVQTKLSLQRANNLALILTVFILAIFLVVVYVFARFRKLKDKVLIDQMQHDIQDYVSLVEEFENKKDSGTDENSQFLENIAQFGLTEREVDVLRLITQGLRNDEIAEKLFISVSTIKTHTHNIFTKLDVRNRCEAARRSKVF